uniref:BCL2-associated athanogene 6 n=1 Tax=Mola mola TaxID=94237 RepID=A0A3Q4BP03_MOLML
MEEQTADIEVTVKTLDSQSRTYTVGLTVKEFKEHIAPSVGIPVDKQRLIYQGRVLQDERTLADYNVGGKVIHLVERAPPPPSQPGSGSGSTSADSGPSSSPQGTSQVTPHDRNANSYVMLGTFNLPVNIMDPQQIQVISLLTLVWESLNKSKLTIDNGSVNVHIDMDQPVQSEPRLRLVLAENLLRDINNVIQRMEGRLTDSSSQTDTTSASAAPPPPSSSSTTSTPSPSAQPMDTSPAPTTPPPPPTSLTQAEGPTPQPGPNHPSPAELAEMLSELRRVEERLQPFIQRAHTILETATTAEYNNNTEREEDQRTLILTWEALRLLGNAIVALSDLRLNLLSPVPRHLHVVRPFSHYATPVTLPGAVHHHIPVQMNLGATVTSSMEGQASPTQSANQSEQAGQGQTYPPQTSPSNQQAGQGQAGPRVIRISHQAVPVVMMQMNTDGPGTNPAAAGQQMPGQPGALPPDFMRNLMQQISQYAAAVATSAAPATATGQPVPPQPTPPGYSSTANSSATTTGPNTPTTTPTAPPPPPHTGPQPQARVVFTRPSFSPNMPASAFGTRGTTINVRAAMPGQQSGQAFNPAALNQMISGLVGQLLLPGQMAGQPVTSSSSSSTSTSTSSSFSSSSQTSSSSSSFSFSTSGPTPPPAANTTSQPETNPSEPPLQEMPPDLGQLLGSLFGVTGGAGVGPVGAPTITVTTSGVPGFMTEFMQQASQPIFSPPPPPSSTTRATGPNPTPNPPGAAEALNPELFTGIVRGVLSSMMGSLGQAQNDTESIAQFMQRLSQATNIFISPEDPTGFFGELLMLVCQTFTMSDLVMLLHGQHQPLGRIQPELSQFFTQNYLNGREPTDENIAAAAASVVNELEEYITESFSSVTVLDGVDVTQTNMSFFRQQLQHIATHILRCTDDSFGPRLLQMCNQALFECLALNLHCLRGDQRALTAVINHRIRRMSSDISPSLVNWMTSMMTMRLQVILEHIPITQEQIQNYIYTVAVISFSALCLTFTVLLCLLVSSFHCSRLPKNGDTLSPAAATTAEEAMSVSHDTRIRSRETRVLPGDLGASGGAPPLGGDMAAAGAEGGSEEAARESEAWAAAVPPEWVPIIRCDMMTQRKMKAQPPLSDAYLHGMPAKRRKTGLSGGSLLSLSDAVSQAARTAGVRPITSAEQLQDDLETQELKEAYSEQVKADIKKRVREDSDFNSQQFPNAHGAFSSDP